MIEKDPKHNDSTKDTLLALTSTIVSAYVSHHNVVHTELASLIRTVHTALCHVAFEDKSEAQVQSFLCSSPLKPAVPIKKSVTPEYIICLDDGKKFKSLKRHLRTCYNISPEEYREKWSLPLDYPMVAPNYAKERSLSKKYGIRSSEKKNP